LAKNTSAVIDAVMKSSDENATATISPEPVGEEDDDSLVPAVGRPRLGGRVFTGLREARPKQQRRDRHEDEGDGVEQQRHARPAGRGQRASGHRTEREARRTGGLDPAVQLRKSLGLDDRGGEAELGRRGDRNADPKQRDERKDADIRVDEGEHGDHRRLREGYPHEQHPPVDPVDEQSGRAGQKDGRRPERREQGGDLQAGSRHRLEHEEQGRDRQPVADRRDPHRADEQRGVALPVKRSVHGRGRV
jgi:hypothetical protein